MNKISWIICGIIFTVISVCVLSIEPNKQVKLVKITNKNITVKNNLNFENDSVQLDSNNTKITNSDIAITNTPQKIQKKEYKLDENSIFRTSNVEIENKNPVSDTKLKQHNQDFEKLKVALASSTPQTSYPKEEEKYGYRYIDWRTWKSNFVNRIVDDSLNISSLDNYSTGTIIYYSFTVYNDGRISNITVSSPILSNEDKNELVKLIKSYEYKPITKFPATAKRKSVWVHAFMVLSDEQVYSKPKDFENDLERVKFRL